MERFRLKEITATLLFFTTCFFCYGQFSFTPKRANLNLKFSNETGWTISDITGSKILTSFKDQNAYIQIVDHQLKIYTLPNGLWNTHPTLQFMNKIHIPHQTFVIATNPSRFDSFSSFWISATGGHIRIFKYDETFEITTPDGKKQKRSNQNVTNHIFINGNSKTQISSRNTIFMISPKGTIFEIDHKLNIWRFILTNRTLTPWTSDPPTEKMVFHIFDSKDFKTLIPIGKKGNKYIFQIINHENKMGIASLSTDYFQIEYPIPPLFDFISPSLYTDYHMVYNDNKLGTLHFLALADENEIPMFKTEYTGAKKSITSHANQNISQPLLIDYSPLSKTKSSQNQEYLETNHLFGIEKISDDLLLYNEYDKEKEIHASGLYRVSQENWYISPNQNLLKSFPNAILDFKITADGKPSYSVYSRNGGGLALNIVDKNSSKFLFLTCQVLEMEIDSMTCIPEYDTNIFKIRVNGKWGLIEIQNENFKILLAPTYKRITHLGEKKSLVLTKEHSFDWFGVNYSISNSLPQLITDQNPLIIYEHNSFTKAQNATIGTAQYIHELYIYNNPNTKESLIYDTKENLPVLITNYTKAYPTFLHTVTYFHTKPRHSILNYNLKIQKITNFDSIHIQGNLTLFLRKDMPKETFTPSNITIKNYQIGSALINNKRIKGVQKYGEIYFHNSLFIAKDASKWIIIDPEGKQNFPQGHPSFAAAIQYINRL